MAAAGDSHARLTPASAVERPRRKATPHGLRIAAIDIGTNSLHIVIVEVTDSLSFKILLRPRPHAAWFGGGWCIITSPNAP